jgi:integrase
LIKTGAHPKAVQGHLGHSSITVTMDVYGHLFPNEMDALAERLDSAHRQAASPSAASNVRRLK